MPSKLGIQYYVPVGLVLGIAFSSLLALLYAGKTSFVEANLDELLATPLVILIAPVAVGLAIGIVLRVFASGREPRPNVPSILGGKQPLLITEVSALGFGVGIFFGSIAALVIFFFAPFPGHGFFSYILFGLIAGGVGSVIVYLSVLVEQWLS